VAEIEVSKERAGPTPKCHVDFVRELAIDDPGVCFA
jgi:hypothetical protein